MKVNLLGIVIILLFGCASGTDPNLGDEFVLKYGQSTSINDQNISITFTGVGADSRCPTGVLCVWEGNAEIFLDINSESYSINTSLDPRIIFHDDYQLELISVSPYPVYGDTIDIEDYEIRVVLIK